MPNIGSLIPPAPNAAALGKYGEIPVSYYTGIPSISVPIYEIKTSSLDVPISLSYHAGGIRVEEIASWVGLGWSLNAGGVITRQVRGLADEADGGYLQNFSTINLLLSGNLSQTDELNYLEDVERGRQDSQQDLFFYNVGGESGKFILDSSGAAITIPATRTLFQLITYNGTPNCWKMTDLKGIQYYFASKETTTTTPVIDNTLSPTALPSTVTSWYLTKIVNAQGTDSINFIYTSAFLQSNSSVAQTKYLYVYAPEQICGPKATDSRYSSSSIAGVRLSQILFKNGSINFIPNTQPRCDLTSDYAIAAIQIKNADSTFDKWYHFFQHYTSATGTVACDANDEDNNHLFLDSLRFSDQNGGNSGQYAFAYNTTQLPSRLSYDQDYWGFYNDAENTSNFVPTQYLGSPADDNVSVLSGANRNPNNLTNQAGILQSITYPTGGSTVFQFESNTAGNYDSLNVSGADVVVGSRVFVVSNVGPSNLLDTTFQITDNFAGLGGVDAAISIDNGGGSCATEESLSCPIVTLTGPSNVGSITSNSNQFLQEGTYTLKVDMRTVTDQSIIDNFSVGLTWSYGASSVDTLKYNIPVGGLRIAKITDYAANNTVTNVRSYQYLYPDSAYHSSGFLLNFPEYSGSITDMTSTSEGGTDVISACNYNTYSSSSNYPLAATQSSYVGYKYVQESLGANGEFGKNIYTFLAPDSYPDLGEVALFPYPPATSEDWKRGQSERVQSYRYNSNSGQYELVTDKISQYQPQTTHTYSGAQIGRNVFFVGVADGTGVTSYQIASFNTQAGWLPLMNDTDRLYDQVNLAAYQQKTSAYTYSNVHYQPISIQTNNSNGDNTTTYLSYPLDYTGLTGSDAFTAGIAALQNSNMVSPVIEKYSQRRSPSGTLIGTTSALLTSYKSCCLLPDTIWSTQFAAPSLSFGPLTVAGGSLVKDGNYVPQVAQVRYDAFSNPVEQLKLNDARQSYLWDYLGSYPICRVVNADSADIAYTSFEADGAGNWSIGSGSVDSTTAITGTRSYNLSGTITKSGLNSSTTYFVSYWTTNNSPFSISGTISGYPVQGKTVIINNNSWTLYVHKVTGQSTITVSGSGHIDELRLYPSTAQMTTYTYAPLVGMTSQTDVGNRVTYYQYDGLQRLKRIRDQDYNILKTFDYQYQAPGGCGSGCTILAMQTFLGTSTPGYPVGVFDIHGNLVGNATGDTNYVSLWNSDTADARVGTLGIGADSMHFTLTLNAGQTAPAAVTGCRYFQYDLPWNILDGVEYFEGSYVDFGDGTGIHLGKTASDTPAIMPPNTTKVGFFGPFDQIWWFDHTYPDTSVKTITFYHNEVELGPSLDNSTDPATSLTKLQNLRGNIPQASTQLGGSCYQQASALTVANISNWNTISSIQIFQPHCGDHINPCENMNYAQDFMANNRGLTTINTTQQTYYQAGYRDTTFKLSRLKSNWNTYFTQLQNVQISDEHWNREDLSGLLQLQVFVLLAGNQNHSNNSTNNPLIPIPSSVTDGVINQIAAGAGQFVSNGEIAIATGGDGRTSASDNAVIQLLAKGWFIIINGIVQQSP